MKILSHRFLILFVISIFNFAVFYVNAQSFKNFSIQRLSQDDGLSQGSNYFKFEDSRGFMWITGNDALNRFDGSSVKVYNLDHYFKNCPRLIQGYGFAEDGKNLYIGSIRGLYKYDYDLDAFTLIDLYQGISVAL